MKDIYRYKKFYFIGIKGVGMTMLAQFLKAKGKKVEGSDISDVFMTDKVLRSAGIPVRIGFDSSFIPRDAVIIYSSAYSAANNVELEAIDAHVKEFFRYPVLSYAQAIGSVFSSYRGIAVCGSHGKTTTSAWLGFVMRKIGLDASVLVGARVPQLGGSAVLGSSRYFVAEADEYQNKLQYFSPYGVLLNNIDYDHPDYFKTRASYRRVFSDFIARIPAQGFLVLNAGDKEACRASVVSKAHVFSYALANKVKKTACVSLLAHSIRRYNGWQYFQVNDFGEFKIRLFGEHNIENALAVLTTGFALGFNPCDLRTHLSAFKGTARRSELMGYYQNIPVYDDYGHHPTEIKATLAAFKQSFPNKRIVVVFHPHTFTRTKALFGDFINSFTDADLLGILEIYGSAREKQGGVSSRDLVRSIRNLNSKQKTKYLSDFDAALIWLKNKAVIGDVIILIGAGDVFRVGERLLGKEKL